MGRKSREQLAEEENARQAEIRLAADRRVSEMLPDIVKAVSEQLSGVRADLGPAAAPATEGGDRAFLSQLAHEIARVGDPANKRRTVSPEVAKSREEACERMQTKLVEAHAKGEMPIYVVRQKIYLQEVLIEPQFRDPGTKEMRDTEINWPSVPNEAMDPVNDIAKEIHKEFLLSIGSMGKAPLKSAPWVISGNEIVRGRSGPRADVGHGQSEDPRIAGRSSVPKTATIRVLGTAAEPARVGQ